VLGKYPLQQIEIAAARGEAAFLGRAKSGQMDVGDAALVEAGGKLPLGKSRAGVRTSRRARPPAA